MNYFASNKVHIYPISTTRNLNVDKGARDTYLSEYAITNLVKASVDRKNYVIDYTTPQIDFVLDGYIFNLDIPTELQDGDLYVKLNMKPNAGSQTFPEVYGDGTYSTDTDSDGNVDFVPDSTNTETDFCGLLYTTTKEDGYFQLLEDGKVPDESTVKINIAKSTDFFLDYKIIVDGNGK